MHEDASQARGRHFWASKCPGIVILCQLRHTVEYIETPSLRLVISLARFVNNLYGAMSSRGL